MSTLLSLAALAALALATFEANNDTEKVFATPDGNIFLSENYARNHARQEKLAVFTITRAEALATKEDEGEADGDSDAGTPGGEDGAPAADAPAPADKPKAKKVAPAANATTTA
jgi:hypothetical protein